MLAQETDTIDGFAFVWFTDGIRVEEYQRKFERDIGSLDAIYSIDDMENGVMNNIFL